MWLSKLVLNPRSAAVRRDLANPYDMHRTLVWAVAGEAVAGRERLLWRLEPRRNQEPVLLVQTLTCPDWDLLLQRHPGYAQVDPTSPKVFDPKLYSGQVLRFRLKANPTVKRLGKRLGLLTEEGKMSWLHRKMAQAGCQVLAAAVVSEERVVGFKEGAKLTVFAALFEGLLRVEEPGACRKAIERGIGPAKGLGLGLLSVAPPR
ncbi:MAG: type I-E CRISPR-associated protein Cas6/Cse3/CasE [Candidatus Acetothermia bacterium]|nr:type I-E CRISPR-associated protein Cas6/Cse3/CasE [Candidatus Acetothermia bacterium]